MPLSRRARFNWWIVVVIAALAAPLWMLIGGATTEMRIAAAITSILALSAMVYLLATTPTDAIKLPWWMSLAIAWLGAAWLAYAGDSLQHFLARDGWMGVGAAVTLTTVGAFPGRRKTRKRTQHSTWDWVPLLWNPIIWAIPWPQATAPSMWNVSKVAAIAGFIAVLSFYRTRWRNLAVPVFMAATGIFLAFSRWS